MCLRDVCVVFSVEVCAWDEAMDVSVCVCVCVGGGVGVCVCECVCVWGGGHRSPLQAFLAS